MISQLEYDLESLDILIHEYPELSTLKKSLDKHRTHTHIGDNLYKKYIKELVEYGSKHKMRKEEKDPITSMVYIGRFIIGDHDSNSSSFKFMTNYPLFGHEFFMLEIDSIVDELNLNVVDNKSYHTINDKQFQLKNWRMCVGVDVDKVLPESIFTDHKDMIIDEIKNAILQHNIATIATITAVVEDDNVNFTHNNKRININFFAF